MPLIEVALPVAAQGFADGRIDVEAALMAASDRSNSLCRDIPRISGERFCDPVALSV
jgi:hypothetical protein